MSTLAPHVPGARSVVSAREAWRLAVPAALSAVLHNAYRPLDQFWVQDLGAEAQGALAATTFVLIAVYASFLLVSTGAGPLVARATGRGDHAERRRVVGGGLATCGLLAAGMVGMGLVMVEPIVWLLRLEGAMAMHATHYLRVLFLTGGALVFSPLIDTSFHAMGNTRLPMILQAAAVGLNAVLTPLLIFGAGLGVAGAALGSTLAYTSMVLVGGWFLWRELGLSLTDVRLNPEVRRILRIGAPLAVATAAYALVYWLLLATSINPLGPPVAAALGIGFGALEAFTWPVFLGTSIALSSMVGRSLGAGRVDDAWRAARMMWLPMWAMGTVAGLVFWFGGPHLVGLFAADPDAYEQALLYATILALSQPFVALEAYGEGVLGGAGDTRKLFWATVPLNLSRVPLAWWLAFPLGFGAAGVWWAINLTSFAKAGLKVAMVVHGGWSRLEI